MTANRFGCETKTNKQQMYCYIVVNYFDLVAKPNQPHSNIHILTKYNIPIIFAMYVLGGTVFARFTSFIYKVLFKRKISAIACGRTDFAIGSIGVQ